MPRLGGPAPTIRLRLTVLYGIVFLITGAVLLTIGYALVRSNIRGHHIFRDLILRPPGAPPPLERIPGADVIRAVQRQILSDALHRLVIEYLFALGVMTMISVIAGWLLAGRALRPLRDITAAARRVSGENLGERIALVGPADELKELADTFDGMLARLDGAFASQRHFVANASHELRTPLAIMRTEVDVALADPDADGPELRAMGEAIRETIDRCERLIEGLLMLARSEAAAGRDETINLASLAADCVTDLRARAEERRIVVRAELSDAWAAGEPALLERLIANLVDNAIQHNEPGGFLSIATGTLEGRATVTVANSGPRIELDDVRTLTEPFRRLQRSGAGFGLGLSIVRRVAEAHGGGVELLAPETGGLEVHVSLPAVAPPAGRPMAVASANVAIPRTPDALTKS
jgi:signal transduction histidine kinase